MEVGTRMARSNTGSMGLEEEQGIYSRSASEMGIAMHKLKNIS